MAPAEQTRQLQERARLGAALGAKSAESVQRTYARIARYQSLEDLSPGLAEHEHYRTQFGTLMLARWLISGELASEEENAWMQMGGGLAAAEGKTITSETRGYYCWRDTVIDMLREEAALLNTPHEVLSLVIEVTRASCDASLMMVLRDRDAEVRRITTELQESNLGLAASERRFRSLFEAIACGVLVTSPDGHVTDFNDAALTILGVEGAQLEESGVGGVYLASRAAVRTGLPARDHVIAYEPGGDRQVRWLQTDAVPAFSADGHLVEVVTSIVDVSSVKQVEEARAESAAKSMFLAKMSHELRTPLNGVLGFAQLLKMRGGDDLAEYQVRYLDNIEASGRHLLSVIGDILDLGKVAAGQMELITVDLPVRQLLEQVMTECEPMALKKGLALDLNAAPDLTARGDPLRVRQVISNLLSNAIKFTDQGGARLEGKSVNGQVEITIEDSGIGIPVDRLISVFDEFTQVQDGSKREKGGTGLGLSIAKRLTELMGGQLTLEPAQPHGLRARLTLPAAVVAAEANSEGQETAA